MRTGTILVLCALWLAGPAPRAEAGDRDGKGGAEPTAGDEEKLKSGDRDPELIRRINRAVERGCAWLRSKQGKDGSWRGVWHGHAEARYPWGETALCLWALRKAGEPKDAPSLGKGFRFLRLMPLAKVYEVSVLALALEARHTLIRPGKREYTQPPPRVRMPDADNDWMRECIAWLVTNRENSWRLFGIPADRARSTPDTWHYPGPAGTMTDHSNTQLALLALKAGRRCGIPVPLDAWVNTVRHFVETQETSGPEVRRVVVVEDPPYRIYRKTRITDFARGWCYDAHRNPVSGSKDKHLAATGSMTTVGVSSLALALSELRPGQLPKKLRPLAVKGIWDGLAWLDRHWRVDTNPRHPGGLWHYYYLYGVERAAVLTGQRNIGRRDWYREGAEYLLARQKSDGSWDDPRCPGPLNNSCFALLFLTKATVPLGVPVTGGGKKK
jgi:hypothetical protein